MSNYDTRTADNCRLPELIPDICERCRDNAYCYRQQSFDFKQFEQEDE